MTRSVGTNTFSTIDRSRVLLITIALILFGVGLVRSLRGGSVMALTPGNGAPTPVYRWNQPTDKDWVTVPAHGTQPSDSGLASSGYSKATTPQYYVDMIGTNDSNMVAVYRWWNNSDKDWVDIRDGTSSDASLTAAGYTNKTFQYYAYTTSATGRVAVNRWWHSGDKDWITLRQDEISDATMTSWGYTNKTLLAYAYSSQSPSGEMGYFSLGTPQAAVVPNTMLTGLHPHTFSVLDVNPGLSSLVNGGYRYLGYFGHNECTPSGTAVQGIYIARSNSLDASSWVEDSALPGFGTSPCRWASALVDGSSIDLVVNDEWDNTRSTLTGQVSTDGLNGTSFGTVTTLVNEETSNNGNPTLFKDPSSGTYYLYWFRKNGTIYEIREKSSSTFAGLVGSGITDIGTLVAFSPELTAAPQVMYVNGKYYLAVETHEGEQALTCGANTNCFWKTRILTSTSPAGPFYEIPGNPVFGAGSACAFQTVVGNDLHVYYCHESTPGVGDWTLDHVKGNLLSPT